MKFYGGGAFYGNNPSQVAFFDGTNATSQLVPDTYNISLNGRNYMVDLSQPFYRQQRRQLEPLIRTQADTSNEPGEQSMDPNGLWRRSYEDWRLGAGQRYLDRNSSQDNAYWTSKGVDTLTTAWQVSLLPATMQTRASTNTNLECLWAAGYFYLVDGTNVYYAPISTITPGATVTWTAVSGLPGTTISSACTDGYTVYVATAGTGIWTIGPGGTPVANYMTSAIDSAAVIGYVNGRLMLGSTNNLYNIVTTGGLPTALETFGNPNAKVTCFATGNNWLYVGVNVGGVGLIYGIQTTADGTTLSPPIIQGQLPNGEKIYALYGYVGFLIAGSGLGVRICQQGSTGVTTGTLIPIPSPVTCLAAYGPFIWFGWTNFDSTDTGLGKISLENFVVAGLLPAYASDRMVANVQGNVTAVAVVNNVVVCAVSGSGFYFDSANLVLSGTVQSGYILYDLTDPKVPALIDVQGAAVQAFGTYEVSLSIDGNAFNVIGGAGPGSLITNTYQLQEGAGSRFEILLTLLADTNTTTQGPVITRWTLRSYPAPLRPKTWQLPIMLDEKINNSSGAEAYFDPEIEINALEAMANTGEQVIYQEGSESYLVFVTDVQFIARNTTSDKHYFNGLALVNIQSIPVPTPQYL